MQKTAIIIGASSGIGKALAEQLSEEGYTLGLAARRFEHLQTLKSTLPNASFIHAMDVTDTNDTQKTFETLIKQLKQVDLIIIAAGTGHHNPTLKYELEQDTINTNINGFTLLAGCAYCHFEQTGQGHLVAISSIAALRGGAQAPAYNASKAYMSNYLEGLKLKSAKEKHNIVITDIRPGFVDTAMAQSDTMFWVASPKKAAEQIITAIKTKKPCAYITKRWRIIAWLLKILPHTLYKKL